MGSSSNVNGTSTSSEKYPYPTEYFNVLNFVPKLSSEGKYDNWKLLMRNFIDRRGLIGFITAAAAEESVGPINQIHEGTSDPTESNGDEAWKRSDNLVQEWILVTLSEETRIREEVLSSKTAKDLWTKLEEIFDANRSVIPQLEKKHKEGPPYLDLQKAAINGNRDKAMAIIKCDPDAVRGPITFFLETALHLAITSSSPERDPFVRELLEKMTPQDVKDLVDHRGCTALHYAAEVGNTKGAKLLVQKNPDLPNVLVRKSGDTPDLHYAAEVDNKGGAKKLASRNLDDLPNVVVGKSGDTLDPHHAAEVDQDEEGAKKLDSKRSDLGNVLDQVKYGGTPLHYAARYGHTEMVRYLMNVTKVEDILADDNEGASLLRVLTQCELYDIALFLLQQKPKLACKEVPSSNHPLEIIAEKPSSFLSGNSSKLWQRLIYRGAPEGIVNHHNGGGGRGDIENLAAANCCISVWQRLHSMIWKVAEKLVSHVKDIREKKERHHHALKLVKFLCMEVTKLNLPKVEKIFKPALCKAASVGIPEIIEEIVLSYPSALFFVSLGELNIIKYAILHRRERVFNLVYQTGWKYIYGADNSSNNVLHLAARLGHEQQINLKAGAAGAVLQMQREMQWYKEVEKFTPPSDRERRNNDGLTPKEVFSDTHQDLVKKGERWMKDTATSCTIVSALIVAMVFAAAITVPGGNDNENGHPLLLKREAFIIFGISNALALFSSITSVLMFLLILTSRYAEEDFLYTLPKRLITGLITLFVSILSTMVAFGVILYLVFGDNKAWILIPVVALASIPVTLFGALQFPLLVEMIHSTYGGGIFGKKNDRALR